MFEGFPRLSATPHPVDSTQPAPPVSTPMYLGKFDFSKDGGQVGRHEARARRQECPRYKMRRSESWTIRGSLALLILPKVEAPDTLDPGALKCGLFSRSKKSPRNWVTTRSETRKD